MTDPPTKAERLAAAVATWSLVSNGRRTILEAADLVAVIEGDSDARKAILAAADFVGKLEHEAEQKVRQIEAEPVEITEADLQAARLTDMGGE